MRPMNLRRSWLFVGAADHEAIKVSNESCADACIQEFEDFCLPEMRQEARRIMPDVLSDWLGFDETAISALRDQGALLASQP